MLPAKTKHYLLTLSLAALLLPLAAEAAQGIFQNPLGITDPRIVIFNIARFVVFISGGIALLALVVGGTRLIIGGFGNEQEAAKAKQILTWAVIGLIVIGIATGIIYQVGVILIGP